MPISQDRLYASVRLAREYRDILGTTLHALRQELDLVRTGQKSSADYTKSILNLINLTYTEINEREARLLAEEIQYRATANRNKSEKERRWKLRRAEGRPIRRQAPEMAWATTDPRFATPQGGQNMAPRRRASPPSEPLGDMPPEWYQHQPDVEFDKSDIDPADLAAQLGAVVAPRYNTVSGLSPEEEEALLDKFNRDEASKALGFDPAELIRRHCGPNPAPMPPREDSPPQDNEANEVQEP